MAASEIPAMSTSSPSSRTWRGLYGLLKHRATVSPAGGVYVRDGRGAQEYRTFSQLLASAGRIAHALGERGVKPGMRVLVAQPTGFEFLSTFFGLQALGAVPVPLSWSEQIDPFRGPTNLARWRRLAERYDAQILVCGDLGDRSERGWSGIWPPHPLKCVTDVAHLLEDVSSRVQVEAEDVAVDDVAYVQSTSGTTGAPRGVELTHDGIYSSVEAIGRRIEVRDEDVIVSWLPLDNIMGLVGVVLCALHWGVRPVLIKPQAFLASPEDWFWAISEHRATLSLAPNFAFNYCVRRCNASQLEGLDLSSWRIAMNGSEPVRAQHAQAFARRFHKYGLRDHVIMPVYGLSEATLGVTFHDAEQSLRIDGVNRRRLENQGRATPLPPDGADTQRERMHVVSVGRPLDGIELRIVDNNNQPVDERVLGEIAIQGPNIMNGYVESTVRDEAPMPTRIDEDGWLLTGDLGYLADGELFFVTRASDRLVLDGGRTIFPDEVELFVDAVDGVRAGSTAVFSAPSSDDQPLQSENDVDGDRVVVAFEVQSGAGAEELTNIIESVLKTHLDLSAHHLLALRARSVPKTPTGKVRRHKCRELFQKGLLGSQTLGILDSEVWARGMRDIGETLRGGGESVVERLQGLFDDG